jgi:gliding motility-associated-like protein
MKKILTTLLLITSFYMPLFAAHIKGGEMFYEYLGPDPQNAGKSLYIVSLKLYIDCSANAPGQLDEVVPLSVFDKNSNGFVSVHSANRVSEEFIRFDPRSNPCIGNPPLDVCYRVRTYSTQISLQNSPDGYIISFQRCCRIIDIKNLQPPSNSYGATYMCEIPGTSVLPDAYTNSGPRYMTNDAAAICRGSEFKFSFGAIDPDGTDSLVYSLCNGFVGASQNNPNPPTSSNPPYTSLAYNPGYFGNSPLGPSVKIDSRTGMVTGIAPTSLGQYVISACTYEYRKGKLINIHRKDIHIAVSDCIPLSANLKPDYSFCDDFLVTFQNETLNPPGAQYTWNFGDGKGDTTTNATQGYIQHQYQDTGTYTVKLKVVLAGQCIDSTTTRARVYPGFFPGFIGTGSCKFTPFQFRDTSKTKYGNINSWFWTFGDETTEDDIAETKNASWLYNSLGIKRASLIVTSDKGCIDTVYRDLEVRDIPLMSVPFRDTLICSVDTLQLSATGNGIFSWSPNYNISATNIPNPKVWPKTTTKYKVTLNENGCINSDSINVRVVDFVTLDAGADTTICASDAIRLNPNTDGLQFTWTPNTSIDNINIKNPTVNPSNTITYSVTARIGKCVATDNLTIRTVPYPGVNAGLDTVVCFEDTARLNGSIVGSSFSWSPSNTLSNSRVLDPFAFPTQSQIYTLTVFDTLGCPKPSTDQVLVTVREKINAFAGNDTVVVIGQPLQLQGSGAELFEWTPPEFLNRRDISSPVAILDNNTSFVLKAYTEEGCFGMDTMSVMVFKTAPDIFVPNAFTPEGKNKILKPVSPGIATLNYFRIYNRWGQLMYQTKTLNQGWNGIFNGKMQDTGTYVWMVSGKDYTGKTISKKGTSVLIR